MIGARSITDDEVRSIASALGLRDRCLFVLGIRTGFRIAELLSLNVNDVYDDKTGSIRDVVKVSKANVKGKTASRSVPMHPEAAALIREYLEAYPVRKLEYPLFRTNPVKRMHQRTFNVALKNACTRASIRAERVSSHAMRKTFAQKFYAASNKDLYMLCQALGHSHIGTTVKYLQHDSTEISEIIRKLK